MSLFNSKIEPILAYANVIWEVESNNNSILIKGLEEVNKESTNEQVEKLFRQVSEEPEVKMKLETIKRIGRTRETNKNRPILVKFIDYGDKEMIIYSGKFNINSISIEDSFSRNTFKEIPLLRTILLSMPLTYANNAVIILVGMKWENFP